MKVEDIVKIVDQCENRYGDIVHITLFGDGSGGLYANVYNDEDDEILLVSWDGKEYIEKTLKEWLKNWDTNTKS